MSRLRIRRLRSRDSQGQSLTELALVLPVFLLILMVALDFGRVYLGWVNLQSMARIAANFAANNASAWNTPVDTAVRDRFRALVANDAQKINCTLPNPVPDPVFAAGSDLGDPVTVAISCRFQVITPIISAILGGDVVASGSSTFPVKQGALASVGGGGGGPIQPIPVARFGASPTSGFAPLIVQFTDSSAGRPTSWTWDFGDGASSFEQSPSHTFAAAGTYTVSLTVTNAGGADVMVANNYVQVVAPPTVGAVPQFSAVPRGGGIPLVVAFTDQSTGGPSTWAWNFGDGGSSALRNPSHTYTAAGAYAVSLTVSDGVNPANTQTKNRYIIVACQVPNFANEFRNAAQGIWGSAGFTTTVTTLTETKPPANYKIRYQSLPGGLLDPPGGCGALITVGP